MKKFMTVVLLMFSVTANADLLDNALNKASDLEYSAFYAYKSHHWISENTTNDTHHLVGIRVGSVAFGRFDNSFGRETYFLGLYGDYQYKDVNFFGLVGAMHGYTTCYGEDFSSKNVCPLLGGGVSYTGWSQYFQPTLFQLGDATAAGLKADF